MSPADACEELAFSFYPTLNLRRRHHHSNVTEIVPVGNELDENKGVFKLVSILVFGFGVVNGQSTSSLDPLFARSRPIAGKWVSCQEQMRLGDTVVLSKSKWTTFLPVES